MGLSDCECGGTIALGPIASNRCDKCGKGVFDPFPPGHVGDWVAQLRQENDNQRKALQIILDMRYCDESLTDAQMIAAMVLNPQDYSLEARQAQGLC
jgi:hypothetical protein